MILNISLCNIRWVIISGGWGNQVYGHGALGKCYKKYTEKIEFEKSPPPPPKKKGVNLNFLTILDHFWDLLTRLKTASFGHWKRFKVGLSFIGRIIVEKIDFEKRPPRKSKEVNLNLFWRFRTIFEIFVKKAEKSFFRPFLSLCKQFQNGSKIVKKLTWAVFGSTSLGFG